MPKYREKPFGSEIRKISFDKVLQPPALIEKINRDNYEAISEIEDFQKFDRNFDSSYIDDFLIKVTKPKTSSKPFFI